VVVDEGKEREGKAIQIGCRSLGCSSIVLPLVSG
jgi:hypothetical protein